MENNNGDIVNSSNHQPPPSLARPQQPAGSSNSQIRNYWLEHIEQVTDFKTSQLPKTRIKKIMKADPDVHMVSADAPVVLAKACEMFIVDLTMRSWVHAAENKRRTLQKIDISDAVASNVTYDFLADVVPKVESIISTTDPGFVAMPHPIGGGVPQYYYSPETVVGTPVEDGDEEYTPPSTKDEVVGN